MLGGGAPGLLSGFSDWRRSAEAEARRVQWERRKAEEAARKAAFEVGNWLQKLLTKVDADARDVRALNLPDAAGGALDAAARLQNHTLVVNALAAELCP